MNDKPKLVRCAIYTRKSTEHNLDLEFNSLHAQRDACEAYIKSQLHEGWRLIPDQYNDGAFSGASLERPDLQRLLADVTAGRIDNVVVYKVDRLTRSLTDFARLVELFDKRGVSFVSVTQSFNTTTSMGRLTLNVLLSFAQFEREVIGERVRDKIAASKAKGLWMGGGVPVGYKIQDKKLIIDPDEAEIVRMIFRRYLELGSVNLLIKDLRARGLKTKRFESANSKRGGVWFGPGTLRYLLKNRVYVGEIAHRGQIHIGDHAPILDKAIFESVNAQIRNNAPKRKLTQKPEAYLLTGLLFDSAGNRMTPTHTLKKGVRYRYYMSHGILKCLDSSELGEIARVSAPFIEEVVLGFLHRRTKVVGIVADVLRSVVKRITIRSEFLECDLIDTGGAREGEEKAEATRIPWQPKPASFEKGIVHVPTGIAADGDRGREREALLQAIAQSRGWVKELTGGVTIAEIARRDGRGERQIRLLLDLAFLPPGRVKNLLDGIGIAGPVTDSAKEVPIVWPRAE